jgi:hypothetical protein
MKFYKTFLLPLLTLAQFALGAEDYYNVRSKPSILSVRHV